jgi:hypothetical protein
MLMQHRQRNDQGEWWTMGELRKARHVGAAFAVAALTGLLAVVGVGVGVGSAHAAGTWIRTNCANPDGSTAPSDGWSGDHIGQVSPGSSYTTTCAFGSPMFAFLSSHGPALDGSVEFLQYTPPQGSTLVGGSAWVGLWAGGYGEDHAGASAAMLTPAIDYSPSNVFMRCAALTAACPGGFEGKVDLPPNKGGNLYVSARCKGDFPWTACKYGGMNGVMSMAWVGWANLVLRTDSLPTGSEFRGGLLDPSAHGTTGLTFTAADDGPGVYKVIVTIDGTPVYDATPNSNAGKCVPVATDAATGALMWQWQQPCPQSQTVDVQVRTTTLADGPHELAVTVVNPARDVTTVLRRTITTNNRTTVSATLTSDRISGSGVAAPAPVYAVVLDARTRAFARGVRRDWSHSGLGLSGTLTSVAAVPAPGVLVTLFARYAGQRAARAVARTSTDAAGHWALAAPRGPSRRLAIVYGEQPDPASTQAIRIRQVVTPDVGLAIRRLGGGRLRFSGRLRIKPLGRPRPLVVIQTRNGAGWQALGTALRVKGSGSYSVIYDGGPRAVGGSYAFRAVVHATSLFATGISPIRRTVVR